MPRTQFSIRTLLWLTLVKVLHKVVLRGRPGETMFTTDNGDTVTIEFSHD